MDVADLAQRYLDGMSLQSNVVAGLLAKAGTTGAALAPFLEHRTWAPGDVLIEQGSRPEHVLLVLKGTVTAEGIARSEFSGRASEAVELNQLGRYDVLGEVSMITRQPAIATLTAEKAVEALALSHASFSRLMKASPLTSVAFFRYFAENIVEKIRTTQGIDRAEPPLSEIVTPVRPGLPGEDVEARLLEVPAVGWSEAEARSGVAELFTPHRARAGDVLVGAGESADALYVLVSGTARRGEHALTGGDRAPENVLVGEMSFLRGHRREADVVAVTDCTLLALAAGAEAELAERSPGFCGRLHLALLRAVCARLTETSEESARSLATQGGDWEQWFV
ncbi:MAG: Crp/Fnr family transcriptional regulator [Myxococcota bacterium]